MVSATAGNFTCAELQQIDVEVERIWLDTQQNRDYISKVDILAAIRTEQTARLELIEDPEKDQELKVYWPADCNENLADCDDYCVIGGPEAEAKCKTYALDICKTTGFSIRENVFRTSKLTRAQVVAKSLAKRLRELDEFLARTVVAKLDAFAGANQFLDGLGDPDNNDITYIAPSYWTPDIYGYFSQVSIMNQWDDVFLIHGSNLFQMYWQAKMNSVNQDQKDQLQKMESIRTYWDMFNIQKVEGLVKASYMVARGAVAFANKAYYPLNQPVTYFTQQRWSIESKALPGVFYDVYYTNECVSPNEYKHSWSLYVKAGIFQNPFGCNEAVTGVIKFVCGENAGS